MTAAQSHNGTGGTNMESLTQPQFIAFLFTIGVPILALVWNQIKTNKKMVESDEKLHSMLETQQEKHEEMLEKQQEKHDEMLRSQQSKHEEIMQAQGRREEMLRVTLNKMEEHLHKSGKEHAVLMDRTSTKDQ